MNGWSTLRKKIAALSLLALPTLAAAQWPSAPVRIMVPFAPGALTDLAARNIAAELSNQIGQQFVVENKGGAAGTIGTAEVAKARPDGQTLVFTDSSLTISPGLYRTLPYDVLRDFTPVTIAVEAPAVMVARTGLGVKTVAELIALTRTKPKGLTFGSGGQGSSAHLATELFLMQAGIEMTHVPFRGVAAALTDTAGNQIDVTVSSLGGASGHIRGNRVVPLAVTGTQRSPAFPELPTFAQAGYPTYDVVYRFGFLAPAGTPAPVITRLQQEIAKAMEQPKVKAFLDSQGARAVRIDGAEFTDLIRRELAMWKQVIERAGVKAE
ncbi:MAG: tripartite tricarboxylate transporter substrate binding protein [Betaproteobacteria bacterium]|nr:tripartite tricarboxylate transporter substrate binding protein [Betaproteobacteria bacterium]